MPKVRTTLTIDASLMRAVRIQAARSGRRESAVIEDAVRRDLGAGVLVDIWAHNDMNEDEAMGLALEAQHATRRAGKSTG